jgi:DNA-binding response OmpR family regulator
MKQVLLIDNSDVFRDFLKEKLTSLQVEVEVGISLLDSLSKMRSTVPDLVIIDFNSTRAFIFELLTKKKADPNAKDIPVLVIAQKVTKEETAGLGEHGVKKILPKPVRIDQLFQAISDVIHVDFMLDSTPCILEARVNDNVVFVEIAQGLNREKIGLLKYKIRELMALYELSFPKVLIMMTDLSLSFVDGPNLDLLMGNVMSATGTRNRNIKILTLDPFVRDFITGNKEYADIQILSDLSKALDSLLKDVTDATDKETVISERILTADHTARAQDVSLEMRFKSELESLKEVGRDIRIAVVDDDVVIRTVLAKTFQAINAKVEQFETGTAFVSGGLGAPFDLIFLDLMMPEMNGFEVLVTLRNREITTPVIVLSAVSQRDAVLKVLSSGVKSYMIKPLKPEAILKKAIEVLQGAM